MIDDVFAEVRGDRDGGANGSIIGRTTFQLSKSGRSPAQQDLSRQRLSF
jgi:hypothetical protein